MFPRYPSSEGVQALVSELDLRNLRSTLNLHSALNFQNVQFLSLLFPPFPSIHFSLFPLPFPSLLISSLRTLFFFYSSLLNSVFLFSSFPFPSLFIPSSLLPFLLFPSFPNPFLSLSSAITFTQQI